MAEYPAITLRYFDCRGRAQSFRYFLSHRGIAHTDDRVPLGNDFAAWQALKPQRKLTGAFGKLPALHWGETLVSETSVIHRWLHSHCGDEAKLTETQQLQHEMLASSCYGDLLQPHALLLWSDLMMQGSKLEATAMATLDRVRQHLAVMERTLYIWAWWTQFEKRELMLTDFLLWEVLHISRTVFGEALKLNLTPGLDEYLNHFPALATCQAILDAHPGPITARPGEAAAISHIRKAVML